MIFVMDVFNFFSDGNTVSFIGYAAISIVLLTVVAAIIISIFQFCV